MKLETFEKNLLENLNSDLALIYEKDESNITARKLNISGSTANITGMITF